MGTRCQIGSYEKGEKDLKNFQALVYRHYDGYPEGILPDIVPVLRDFDQNRGLSDVEYSSAWLVRELKKDYLNIGISRDFHGDIEYFYAIFPDRVEVYTTPFDSEPDQWSKIKTVDLGGLNEK